MPYSLAKYEQDDKYGGPAPPISRYSRPRWLKEAILMDVKLDVATMMIIYARTRR